ncbi:hypothetical protein SAMN05421863_106215 [Nitrosomonas communis]|uniref:Uncharacterized protein n=1 Tax=Nitrosomonas communis TaxID=44574 RepID=A0A1I4UAZ6_9PROT|nr:hypothetical protein SAMN05421863_106215 [Nitrosomonas communis]
MKLDSNQKASGKTGALITPLSHHLSFFIMVNYEPKSIPIS